MRCNNCGQPIRPVETLTGGTRFYVPAAAAARTGATRSPYDCPAAGGARDHDATAPAPIGPPRR